MNFHFCKIIATCGPSIDKETILSKIISKVDIFRINLSHGNIEQVKKYIEYIRNLDSSKAIMLDTKGPEIRIKNKNEVCITPRQKLFIKYSEDIKDNKEDEVYINFFSFEKLKKDMEISIDDNKILLKIKQVEADHIVVSPIICGTIKPGKSLNFKNFTPDFPLLTEEDKEYIKFGIKNNVSLLALSFVRTKEDILTVRQFLKDNGGDFIKIISKIETVEAIKNIDEIIKYSDGIMIARGDLGSNLSMEVLPKLQLDIISKCNRYGKPVIVATQVFESMIYNPVPTRAEVDEVVYNIKNGVDAFMLSGETAVGKYPIETINWLWNIIDNNYDIVDLKYDYKDLYHFDDSKVTDYIIYTAFKAVKDLDIKAIICPTETGYTPSRLASLKPIVPVIAFTTNNITFKYLNLLWGVKGFLVSKEFDYNDIKKLAKEIVRNIFKGEINLDDKILIVHSSIVQNVPGMINGLEILKFKDI